MSAARDTCVVSRVPLCQLHYFLTSIPYILEGKKCRCRSFEVDVHLLKAIIENDAPQATREVVQELGAEISTVVRHWIKLGKWGSWTSGSRTN